MAKRRRYSLEKKQEQISRKQMETFLEAFEWTAVDIVPDLGEDFLIRIYDSGNSTGLSLYIQLKSVKNIDHYLLMNGVISFKLEVDDLKHWEGQTPPVFLVIWDINKICGWWGYVEEVINHLTANNPTWRCQKTIQVHISPKNRLDENGLGRIRRILADLYFPIVAKDKDFDINIVLKFPRTPEGKAKLAEVQQHIAAGDEVEVDEQYIVEFNLPDWWTRLYGEEELEQMKLEMGPAKSPITHSAQIDFFSPELGIERIPYVELCRVKQGQEELTLSNEHQNIPYKFLLVLNARTGENTLNYSINFSNIDVLSASQAIHIQHMMASGGRIQFVINELEISETILINPGVVQPPDDNVKRLIDHLCLVQQLTGERIIFPQDGSYSQIDVEIAEQLALTVKTGVNRKSGKIFSVELRKEGIQQIVKAHQKNEPIRFRQLSLNSHADILSSKIELGPMTQFITGIWDIPLEDVIAWLEQAEEDDSLTVRLINSEIVFVFDNWVKENIQNKQA